MKSIKELKNIHKGEDIYVIASGPSLNHIQPSFFNNKITIGVNQAYRKLDCTYLVRKEKSKLKYSIENTKSKVICSEFSHGGKHVKNTEGMEQLDFYYFKHFQNRFKNIEFKKLTNDMIVVSYSTITSAMHVAAYMGASNLILVGHDCGLINDKHVFDGYYESISETPWKDWNDYKKWLSEIEDQTINVKAFIKSKYKCEVYSLNPFVNYNLEGNSFRGKNNIN
jgi:ADP-heptose:LPS heptosyltransferase